MIDEGELVVTVQAHADLLGERDRLRDLLREARDLIRLGGCSGTAFYETKNALLARIREAIGKGT